MNIFYSITGWLGTRLMRMAGKQSVTAVVTGGDGSNSITFDNAMQISTYWACIKLLSETLASLPLTIYKLNENGRKIDENHALSVLFNGKVNRYQTKIEFFETFYLNLFAHGNSYCLIQRLGDRIVSLLPLNASQVEVDLLPDGSLAYTYTEGSLVSVYSEKSIWHVKLMGNGVVGLSPLDNMRNSLGIVKKTETLADKVARSGGVTAGVLYTDRLFTPEQREIYRKIYKNLNQMEDGNLMVLEANLKFQQASLSPKDIELLSMRQFNISEIARWFNLNSFLVNDPSSSTTWGSGIAHIMSAFYKLTLRPHLERVESSIKANLMTPVEALRREVEFDFEALTRSDSPKERFETYRVGVYAALLTPNEIRAKEGLPPKEGGDELVVQGANVKLTDLLNQGAENGNQATTP